MNTDRTGVAAVTARPSRQRGVHVRSEVLPFTSPLPPVGVESPKAPCLRDLRLSGPKVYRRSPLAESCGRNRENPGRSDQRQRRRLEAVADELRREVVALAGE